MAALAGRNRETGKEEEREPTLDACRVVVEDVALASLASIGEHGQGRRRGPRYVFHSLRYHSLSTDSILPFSPHPRHHPRNGSQLDGRPRHAAWTRSRRPPASQLVRVGDESYISSCIFFRDGEYVVCDQSWDLDRFVSILVLGKGRY
jgi:hypothetical protein